MLRFLKSSIQKKMALKRQMDGLMLRAKRTLSIHLYLEFRLETYRTFLRRTLILRLASTQHTGRSTAKDQCSPTLLSPHHPAEFEQRVVGLRHLLRALRLHIAAEHIQLALLPARPGQPVRPQQQSQQILLNRPHGDPPSPTSSCACRSCSTRCGSRCWPTYLVPHGGGGGGGGDEGGEEEKKKKPQRLDRPARQQDRCAGDGGDAGRERGAGVQHCVAPRGGGWLGVAAVHPCVQRGGNSGGCEGVAERPRLETNASTLLRKE